MSTTSVSRRVVLGILIGTILGPAGGLGGFRRASAADPTPDKEYMAVFRRGSNDWPFAIIEKPRGVPIGNGSNVAIDAFALRVAKIDAAQAMAFRQRLPELDGEERQKLPPGFTVYADKGNVEVSYAAGSRKYTLTFIDPVDVTGTGGGGGGGGGNSM